MDFFKLFENTNEIADVIILDSGKVIVAWKNKPQSVVIWDCFDDFEKINVLGNKHRILKK